MGITSEWDHSVYFESPPSCRWKILCTCIAPHTLKLQTALELGVSLTGHITKEFLDLQPNAHSDSSFNKDILSGTPAVFCFKEGLVSFSNKRKRNSQEGFSKGM